MPKTSVTSIADLVDAASRFLAGTRTMSVGGLTIAGTKSKIKNASTLIYSIGGLIFSKATTDNLFVYATGSPVQAVSTTCYYLVTLDTAGTGGVITAGGSNYLPVCPDGACPVGIVKIVTDSTHTFTPGTTLHDAAGITATITDISVVPLTLP